MPLRQLYPDPKSASSDAAKVDIIAVHGLKPRDEKDVNHAWDTWRTPAGPRGRLWLRDDLPQYIPESRIFLYEYNSTAVYGQDRSAFVDGANEMLEWISVERDGVELRPIVLLGHSIGGLLIKQALINAHYIPKYTPIKHATTGLAFFATPHHGGELVSLGGVAAKIATSLGFQQGEVVLETLKDGSIFSDITQELWRDELLKYGIVSFWGAFDKVVPMTSVRLHMPGDHEIVVTLKADHSTVCKFGEAQTDQDNFKLVRVNIKGLYKNVLLRGSAKGTLAEMMGPGSSSTSADPGAVPLFPIIINGNTLDQMTRPADDASWSNYILVQSRARLTPEQRQDLVDMGLVLHSYVGKNTYLYRNTGRDLESVRRMEPIVYADIYRRELKIASDLKGAALDQPYKVDVVFHDDVDVFHKHEFWEYREDREDLRTRIAKKSHLKTEEIEFFQCKARLTVLGQFLEDVASVDEVRCIEEVGKTGLRNNRARAILKADVHRETGTMASNITYEGRGQVIAIADSGFDEGSTTNMHHAFQGRVLALEPIGRPVTNDFHGHGTHVCGSAVGDGLIDGRPIRGTAPQARLVVQCLGGDFDASVPGDLTQLFTQAYNHGARIHSNSWGKLFLGKQHKYDQRATEIDKFVHEHKEMVICFAAGNDGGNGAENQLGTGTTGQIGSESAAKNCITVGATENFRPEIRATDGKTCSISQVAVFSSRGPTKEQRNKPDLVAPGTWILSANSRCGNKAKSPGPNEHWCYMSGTSMATPLVAGCAAVLREVLIGKGHNSPSAALIKAVLINGAVILTESTPDVKAGFGRVSLADSIAVACRDEGTTFHEDSFHDQYDLVRTYPVRIFGGRPTLKVTLAWTDPPDADLRIVI